MNYVELHCRSAFSFLRGASAPEQLAEVAAELGLPAMAICDRDGVYGAPRFFNKAKENSIRAIIGSEITLEEGSVLPVLVETRTGYQNLCRLLTRAHLRSPKGEGRVRWDELPEFSDGLVALTGDEEGPLVSALCRDDNTAAEGRLRRLKNIFGPGNLFIELQRHCVRGEDHVINSLLALAAEHRLLLLATNGVLYAKPYGRDVLDVFTCIRNHTHLDVAGKLLALNGERHLKDAKTMQKLFADLPGAIENTTILADRLRFSLENLGYEFPKYPIPVDESPDSFLRKQVMAGARERYGSGLPAAVLQQLNHELNIIQKLGFAGYFLIAWDIVRFCRESNIMIQGRGSAANSAVCFCLGITAVDPVSGNLLFERFLSEGRKSWPDIDLDLPSGDRRERVIQEIYRRYGKHGAAMTANVITYRGRSAAREIGKALNFPSDVLDRFSNLFASGDFPHTMDLQSQMQQAGIPKAHPRSLPFAKLYQTIYGLPRHLGQHSGGMIICQGQLDSIVPLENASMPGRVVAQWDKEDCDDLGIIKLDLLGLGMMSVIQDAIELTRRRGHPVDLAKIPKDDAATFKMMEKADTIGVFQIESRAQMATLPRMKPKCFYDVVIEVAIIRPGPIQGDMVHPYLARRAKREKVNYFDDRLIPVLERTLGVPLFQEQMLKIAMVMANFSGDEAEELRRAISFHRSQERMQKVEIKLREGMRRNNVAPDVIDKLVQSISSFALYGFPESHAISFAILAYGSAYLKVHYAPEFYASLLNNQPMGFYSPATIVKDAKRHGLVIRPVCVRRSEWNCTIEADNSVRLGFRVVQGLREDRAMNLIAQRQHRPFSSICDFKQRVPLHKDELRTLAQIGALNDLTEHRRDALWHVEKQEDFDSLLVAEKDPSPLAPMNPAEHLSADYSGMQLTTGPHPMALLRPQLKDIWRAVDLPRGRHGERVRIAGNVICRQRPGTAKGFVFISLEDETGVSNAIVNPTLFEKMRLLITQEDFLIIEGHLQNTDNVVLVKTRKVAPLPHGGLIGSESHDFH